MQFKHIDYITTVFEHSVLTKIAGEPTCQSLCKIKRECAANATLVHSNLGGGAHGLLGLVLLPTEYALASQTPFICLIHPGALVLPAGQGVTNLQRKMACDAHNEAIRVFTEVNMVKKALIKQVSAALPELYLQQFRDIHSHAITTPLAILLS